MPPRKSKTRFRTTVAATCDICDLDIRVGDEVVLESGYLCHAGCSDNPDPIDDELD